MKNKTTAFVLAILLGGFGAHKFYLGKTPQGFLYLIFFWTYIPAIVALIEGVVYITKSDEEFNRLYNKEYFSNYSRYNHVVHVQPTPPIVNNSVPSTDTIGKTCPKCNYTVVAGSRFCEKCGSKL